MVRKFNRADYGCFKLLTDTVICINKKRFTKR